MTDLLPCPFCGEAPKCSTSYRGDHGFDDDAEVAICFECLNGCSVSKDAPSYDAAVAIWNTRAPAQCASDVKLKLFLSILQSAGGQTSGNDYPWNWINYFCDDAAPMDTFNEASKRKLTRVTHDSDADDSVVYLTDAGRKFIAGGAALSSTNSCPTTELSPADGGKP